ncbi:MAG: hypothetical protein ACT6FE_05920, partial [Methanosarcinaceae archaeon]
MFSTIKQSLKETPWGQRISKYRTQRYHAKLKAAMQKLAIKWNLTGHPLPDEKKQITIKKYATKFAIQTFIETGTYKGDMVEAVKDTFSTIHSVELDEKLYEAAKLKFKEKKHIAIHQGDSTDILPAILQIIEKPCVFWLNGHYSGGITARGQKDTPIIEELKYIFNHQIKNHVILIDDARCFTGKNDYPTLTKLKKFVSKEGYNYTFDVPNDI